MKKSVFFFYVFFLGCMLYAQSPDKAAPRSLKISGSMQFWARYTELNPGSTLHDDPREHVWDLSIRRYRLKFSGNLTDKLNYTFVLGNNNISSGKADQIVPHLLDAYAEYRFSDVFVAGIGKTGWIGLSRYAAMGTTSALGVDVDFVASPFVNVYDDLLRRMSVYARGKVGRVDYRVVLAKPSYYKPKNRLNNQQATFSDRLPEYQFSAYINYQFLDKEGQKAYTPGSHLGTKNLLNVGVGFVHQPSTSWMIAGDTTYYNATSWAADIFYERKLAGGRGITAYLAYLNHDLGPGFLRYIGSNNPATGIEDAGYLNGAGNSAPVVGTGQIIYGQAGYIRPVTEKTAVQPYVSVAYGQFEALSNPVLNYHLGISALLDGNNSKITFGYMDRPVFEPTESGGKEAMRMGSYVLQYQIRF